MLTKKWLALCGNGTKKNWSKPFLQNFPTTLSPSQTSKPHLPFFHFMWEKIHEAHGTYYNKLIKMKNKTEKLCRLGSDFLSLIYLITFVQGAELKFSWDQLFHSLGQKTQQLLFYCFPFSSTIHLGLNTLEQQKSKQNPFKDFWTWKTEVSCNFKADLC